MGTAPAPTRGPAPSDAEDGARAGEYDMLAMVVVVAAVVSVAVDETEVRVM